MKSLYIAATAIALFISPAIAQVVPPPTVVSPEKPLNQSVPQPEPQISPEAESINTRTAQEQLAALQALLKLREAQFQIVFNDYQNIKKELATTQAKLKEATDKIASLEKESKENKGTSAKVPAELGDLNKSPKGHEPTTK